LRFTRSPRWLATAAVSVAALAYAAPAWAGETATPEVTYSHVTGVTDSSGVFGSNPFFTLYNNGVGSDAEQNQITVNGTSNAGQGQDMRVVCVFGQTESDWYYGASHVYTYTDYWELAYIPGGNGDADTNHIKGDGTWTATFSKNQLPDWTHCLILALPTNVDPTEAPRSFTGPRGASGWTETYAFGNYEDSYAASAAAARKQGSRAPSRQQTRNDGPAGLVHDYWAAFPQYKGSFAYQSFTGGGIDWSLPLFTDGATTYTDMWSGAADVDSSDYTGTRSEVQIDGFDAYGSDNAPYWVCDGDCTNTSPLTYSVDGPDPITGNVTIHESQDLLKKALKPVADSAARGSSSNDLVSTGIRLERTIVQNHEGQLATISDRYVATDGQSHSVDVTYDNPVYCCDWQDTPQWKFAGQDAFHAYGEGDMVDLPAQSTGTVYVANLGVSDGSIRSPRGSITYNTAPNRVVFSDGWNAGLNYVRDVAAGGSTTITQAYSQGLNSTQVNKLAAGAEDSFAGPQVSITSPANGATVASAAQTITGNASDNGGISSLTVNGASVPVAGDGSWATSVTLAAGANTITAIATDTAGNTAQAQTTINFVAPTVAASKAKKCKVPSLRGRTLRGAKRAIIRSNCAVGKITTAKSKKYKAGRIVRQGRKAGSSLKQGTKVALVVSNPNKKANAK
jgi:hypothetical protein